MITIGVLALQGDFLEHLEILREIGVNAKPVKKSEDLSGTDALIIPGGESTTIGTLMKVRNLIEPVIKLAESGVPILGTCAGAVLMAKKVVDRVVGETGQVTLGLMDISVVRNVFGRQKNSFITDVEVEGMGIVKAAFIRAPGIIDAWGSARIIGYVDHPAVGRIGAAALQGNLVAVTFHPEITGDKKVYQYLISKIVK